MKKQTTWFDQIIHSVIKLVLTVTFVAVCIITLSSTEFTITKHKSSFIKDVGNIADGVYGVTKHVKNFIK